LFTQNHSLIFSFFSLE
jgi:phospholipase D1/2